MPILTEIFGGIKEKMHIQNPGFDYIVNTGSKVDVKTALLKETNSGSIGWSYPIRYNRVTDYFLLLAIDDLDNRNILHVWLIHKNDIVVTKYSGQGKFYNREKIRMTNKQYYLYMFEKYEWTNKLKCLKDIQRKLKDMEIE